MGEGAWIPLSPPACLQSSPWATRADHWETRSSEELVGTSRRHVPLRAGSTTILSLPCGFLSPSLSFKLPNNLKILQRSPWMCQLGPGSSVKVTACQLQCRLLCGPWPLSFRVAVRGSLTGSNHCWPSLLNGTQVLLFTEKLNEGETLVKDLRSQWLLGAHMFKYRTPWCRCTTLQPDIHSSLKTTIYAWLASLQRRLHGLWGHEVAMYIFCIQQEEVKGQGGQKILN